MTGTLGLWFSVIIAILAVVSMFVCILKFPKLRIKKIQIDTFWIPVFIAAILLVILIQDTGSNFITSVTANTSLNPLKILILFISVSFLSIALDEAGFFTFIASLFVSKYHNSQMKLFMLLYVLISILTVFTSNDIVILTFTPFIIYLSKKGNINPVPYLVMEFAAANTYSTMLEIGNPTNIYLSGVYNIPFLEYFVKMVLPSFLCGFASLIAMLILFRKPLKKKMEVFELEVTPIKDKVRCSVSGAFLATTTILLAISNYIHLEMYLIAAGAALLLLLFLIIYAVLKKDSGIVLNPLKRIPYNLIPFVLSMFIIITAVSQFGIFTDFGNLLNKSSATWTPILYLLTSTLSCNIVNNIPMTLAYSFILGNSSSLTSVYATIIGSNLGALLTPVGALAGIMWLRILKENDISYSFTDFMKNGVLITGITILAAIVSLLII